LKIKKGSIFIIILLSSLFYSFAFASDQNFTSVDLTPNATISLTEAWNYTTGGAIYTSPVFIDINGDLELEIVFGSDDDYIYCVDNTGGLVWKYQTGGNVRTSPVVADINNDDSMEIIVSSEDEYIYCLNVNGDLIWSVDMNTVIANDLVVADIDLDGYQEIIATNAVDTCYLINYLGVTIWTYTDASYAGGEAAVCDFMGSAQLEIILAGANGPHSVNSVGDMIYLYDSFITCNRPVIADLNRTGINQLLFYDNVDTLKCVNVSNPTEEFWEITDLSDNTIISTPVVADVDSDGVLEILVQAVKPGMHIFGGQGILYCIESNGTLAWSHAWLFFGNSQPLVSDIDNDGDMEIIAVENYVDNDRIYCYDHLGSIVFEIVSSGHSGNSPLIIDVDDDDVVELLCPRLNGDLILCEFNATASGRTLWSREKCSTFNIGQVDSDGDHIDDLSEGFFGTNPELLDSDFDNLADWQEIYSCSTDPTNADSDVDGLNDDEEIIEGNDGYVTDPHDNDTDDDMITDGD